MRWPWSGALDALERLIAAQQQASAEAREVQALLHKMLNQQQRINGRLDRFELWAAAWFGYPRTQAEIPPAVLAELRRRIRETDPIRGGQSAEALTQHVERGAEPIRLQEGEDHG